MSDSEEVEIGEIFFRNKPYFIAYDYPSKGLNTLYKNDDSIEDDKKADLGDYENPMTNKRIQILMNGGVLDNEEQPKRKTPSPEPDLIGAIEDKPIKDKEEDGEWINSVSDDMLEKLDKEQKLAEKEGVSEININKCLDGKSAQEVLRCLRKKRLAQKQKEDKKSKPTPKKRELTTAELNENFKKITPESSKAYRKEMDKLRKEADDIFKKKKKEKASVNDSNKNITISTEEKKDLSKQVAPPRKSKGERVRGVRDDKGGHHKWADGRTKRKTYKLNKKNDVDWSRVRCKDDTCWKTNTRKTDATTKNKKSGDKKVYEYNVDNDHYKGQLRRKKGKRKNN